MLKSYQDFASDTKRIRDVLKTDRDGYGSNAWVVSGSKTETGLPLLANDPHLSYGQPPWWYEIRLKSDNYNFGGYGLYGFPLPVIGHNDHIGWGFTNVMTDDIYEHLVYDNFTFKTIAEVNQNIIDQTLIINGVSKAYAMTGWRIGYAAGEKQLIKAMGKLQSQSTSNPSSISQAAAVEALSGDQSFLKDRAKVFKKRRDFAVSALNAIDGITCLKPEGAFYVFPNCTGLIGKQTKNGKTLSNDEDVVTALLEDAGVAVVQGSAFGLEGYFRISYATSDELLSSACERISKFCDELT